MENNSSKALLLIMDKSELMGLLEMIIRLL